MSPLYKTLLDIANRCNKIVVTPIAQPPSQPKKLSTPNRIKSESTSDYDFENKEFEKGNPWYWNDAKANNSVAGDILAFLHTSKAIGGDNGKLELVEIEEVLDPKSGRAHWKDRHSTRNVLKLGKKIGDINWKEFLELTGGKPTWRIAGTMRCNWSEKFLSTVNEEIIGYAKPWLKPIDENILNQSKELATYLNNRLPEKDKIFNNAIEMCTRTIQAIIDPECRSRAISFADLQAGKTGAMILMSCLFSSIISKKVGIVYITAKSLNAIHNQSIERFKQVGFNHKLVNNEDDEVLVFEDKTWKSIVSTVMLSSNAFDDKDSSGTLKKSIDNLKALGCEAILFLLDEVHVAMKVNQQFDKFLESIGILLTSSNLYSPLSYFVGVTATPFTAYAFPIVDGGNLSLVYNSPGYGYYGLESILSDDRIINVEKEDFTKDKLINLIEKYCDIKVSPKYFVIRTRNKKEFSIAESVAAQLNWKCMEYSSFNNNIDKLSKRLSTTLLESENHHMIIIKDALGAGVTIVKDNILGWYDNAYVNMETLVQSVGRCCGYNVNKDFFIFTNKLLVEEYVSHIKNLKDGLIVPKHKNIDGARWSVITPEYTIMSYEEYNKKYSIDKNYTETEISRTNIDQNTSDDIARFILDGKTTGQQLTRFYTFKDPSLATIKDRQFIPNCKKLLLRYPELKQEDIGLVITNLQKVEKTIIPDTTWNKNKYLDN